MTAVNAPRTSEAVWRTIRMGSAARRVLGWGATTLDLHGLFVGPEGLLPQFYESGQGCEIVDSTGRRYIDWYGCGGCVILGHRRPEVDDSISAQLREGILIPSLHPLELEVAETICEIVPCAETVAFGKNGSDGLTAAVRLARTVTGRDIILQHGFHGFQDWFAGSDPAVSGIPRERTLVHSFPYNDLPALERLCKEFRGRVAAIVMEPTKHELPASGYLEGVRAIADRERALLVFDEVVTALRLSPGGAQSLFGVVPDLACLGKGLGNGMPLSAIVGRRDLMKEFPRVGVGMTFQGEALSLAAARATLAIVRSEPVAQRLAFAGETVRRQFDGECQRLGLAASLTGHPARMTIRFSDVGPFPAAYLLGLFLTSCLEHGVVTSGTLLPSFAHDDSALERSCDAIRRSLRTVSEMTRTGVFRGWVLPADPNIEGYFDEIKRARGELEVSGWLLIEKQPAETIEFESTDGTLVAAQVVARPDVAAAVDGAVAARDAGFRARLALPQSADSPARWILHARSGKWTTRSILEHRIESPIEKRLPVRIRTGHIAEF
jgi:glutamate-1-semialdehyde 2,1-aminomutase